MSEKILDSLLAKLTSGDPAAAEQVFLAYEPYLRMVVRRKLSAALRAKFDSSDIVQSVWTDILSGFRAEKWTFRDSDQLRAFLVRATRNRFIDRVRQHRGAVARERRLELHEPEGLPASRIERASEVVQAAELWDQILAACPADHAELLRLKRQGAPLAEIAAQTGLHKGSVRRILCDVAGRLARRQRRSAADSR